MDIIEFKSFRIEDKPLIDGFFKVHHYEQIDCTFNTLFLWQEAHDTKWAVRITFFSSGQDRERICSSSLPLQKKKRISSTDWT